MKNERQCPWCDGRVISDDDALTVLHSVPVCARFTAAVAQTSGTPRGEVDADSVDAHLAEQRDRVRREGGS